MNDIWMSFKLGDFFRPGHHKVAMSLPDLVQQTNSFSTKNRPGCSASLLKSNPKDLFLSYNVKCTMKDSDPAGHNVKVHFDASEVKDETTAKNLDTRVSCTCPAFLWWGGQWNSHQRDALEGEPRDMLTAPTERLDLRENFVICKHIAVVGDRILPSVQHNIVKILRQRKVDEAKNKQKEEKPKLRERQDQMRDRQQVKEPQPKADALVRKQLEEGIKRRDAIPEDIVQRDTPATPEEQEREPVITPVLPPTPPVDPTPEAEEPVPPVVPTVPKPPVKPMTRTPQRMPQMTQQDRVNMQQLMRDERKRRNRETNTRMRNNPGWR